MDVVGWLDGHEGTAIVLVTLAYTITTLLLVLEARRQRVGAEVAAWPAPWELADGRYLAIYVENAGQAVAREVTVDWKLVRNVDGAQGRLVEPVMIAGDRRIILPLRDPDPDGEGTTAEQLAVEGASIEVVLSWKDGRRGRHRTSATWTAAEVWTGYSKSGALPRPSQLEVLGEIRKHLRRIADKP